MDCSIKHTVNQVVEEFFNSFVELSGNVIKFRVGGLGVLFSDVDRNATILFQVDFISHNAEKNIIVEHSSQFGHPTSDLIERRRDEKGKAFELILHD